jgi:hypothetical protein
VLFGNETPPSIHLTLDPLPPPIIESLLSDLRDAVRAARSAGTAAGDFEYGLAKGARTARWIARARQLLDLGPTES